MFLFSLTSNTILIKETKADTGKTFYVDDDGGKDFTSIKLAVNSNSVSSGDTIYVYSGIYSADIRIEKTLNLIGENKNTTIINGSESIISVSIKADSVKLCNFTIQNNTEESEAIWVYNNSNCEISNCNIINGGQGIQITKTKNLRIHHCNISNNQDRAIQLQDSDDNKIHNCNILNNEIGIVFHSSCRNKIYSCNISSNNGWGVNFYDYNQNNTFYECIISSNNQNGIRLPSDNNNNLFYHNNIYDNDPLTDQDHGSSHEVIDLSNNIWYNKTLKQGNYWGDYSGVDSEGDGFGDTAYSIFSGNEDPYPSIKPYNLSIFASEPEANETILDGNPGNTTKPDETENNNYLIFILITSAIIVVIGIVIYIKRKQKN